MARAQGHDCQFYPFDAPPGGGYCMVFVYEKAEAGRGKLTEDADIFTETFVELVADEKMVEAVQFESADPAIRGEQIVESGTSAGFLNFSAKTGQSANG